MWQTTLILHHQNMATAAPLRCISCGRLLMKINRKILTILNTQGATVAEIPTGVGYQEVKCRGCEMMYNLHWT
jgi:DNA-directed RNA polymerase subunit N (RpoN/RPB10)